MFKLNKCDINSKEKNKRKEMMKRTTLEIILSWAFWILYFNM